MSFELGDRVQLKSGGPVMTVTIIGQNSNVQCTWFATVDASQPSTCYFPPTALKKIG
jgi:uncharacterized protein YodC (DUF2158 family)